MAGHTTTAAPPTTVSTYPPIIGDLAARYRTLALDGCDGTGKTTLATHLATQHGFHVIHSTRTPDGLDLTARYRDLLTGPGPIVLDRCFVAELVYGPLRHGRSRLTLAEARLLAAVVGEREGDPAGATMEIRHAQKLAWNNKLTKGFNTTDPALEFGLLTAEVGEAFTAWRKHHPTSAKNSPTSPSTSCPLPR